MIHPVMRRLVTNQVPKVPFSGCQYLSTLTSTVDQLDTTFTGFSIGIPHPDRLIILAIYHGVNSPLFQVILNGYNANGWTQLNEYSLAHVSMKEGTIGDLIIGCDAASHARMNVSVYSAYPLNHIPVDGGADSAAGTSDVVVSNIKAYKDGFLVYSVGQHAVESTWTASWNGTDAVVEDYDAVPEAGSSHSTGHINFTYSSDDRDLQLSESLTGLKRLVTRAWGPPRYYGGG
jgi:hypothetical protein